ncbi:amidohydrolase family protein [Nonomuraea sp. NBC_01738]|uniref:amidohydrolase family protein n=1 Tax=Nonomuraea sp. NBC_01738 TaxID=2976003 RepID=UPI002E121961|nr:amidohydrolase family protein [Nonomuraea sp. NBC_01738]
MIIDVHAHWGPWFFTMDVARANLATMDRYGIDRSIVSATEAVIYDTASGNRALDAWLATTERHYGYVTINPRRLDQAERDLAAYLPTGRFKGVKIHTDYTGCPPTSPQTREALAMVAAAGVPALVHTWGASVLDLAETCRDTPGLRVIAGHMGADSYRLAIEAARGCDRLYLEPCWSYFPTGRIAEVVERVDTGQLLFGTDSTLIDPSSAFGSMAAARLDEDTAERIAWRNATELFAL